MRASGGSDLNSGSTSSDVASGSDSATYTSTAGNFDGTSVFTPTDNQTTTSFVAVGDYVSLYNTGDTVTRAVAKVLTVGAGNNGAITIDTTVLYGTVPTSNSGSRACKKGGSWASLALGAANGILATVASVPQSTQLNIKAGTYANTTTSRAIALGGTQRFPFLIQGYQTTPGDQVGQFQAVAGTNIPSLTWTTGNFTISNTDVTLANLDITGASGGAQFVISANRWKLQEVRSTNTNATAAAIAFSATSGGIATSCNFNATTTSTKMVNCTTVGSLFYACIFNGGAIGLLSTIATDIDRCLFYGQTGDGINISTTLRMTETTMYGQGGNGVNFITTVAGTIANCYFEGITTAAKAAVNNTSGTNSQSLVLISNAFFNNTANYSGFQEPLQFQDNGTLASSALTNPGSQDFSLKSAYFGLGYPGQYEAFAASRGYANFGALNPQTGGGVPGRIMQVSGQSFPCH